MVRTSVVQLIFFIALVSVSAMAVGTVVSNTGLYAQATDDASEREAAAIATEISIVNDADSDANYDGETATLYVKNVGGETIDPDDLEVLIDGEYASIDSTRVIGGDYWREGRVAEFGIGDELDPGDHRIAVHVEDDRDALEFEYRVAFWLENQTDDALTYDETDDVYEVDTDTGSFDVTMGTDPEQEDETVQYSYEELEGSGFVTGLDPEEGVTDGSGQNTTTVSLDPDSTTAGDEVEISLDVGWDTDTIVVRVVDE